MTRPVHVGSPRATALQQFHEEDAVREVVLFSVRLVYALVSVLILLAYCLVSTWHQGPAKSWVRIFWGSCSLSGTLLVLAPPGAVPAVGGVLVPLGTAVPWGDSPRVQGGPWAPPPCCDNSPETLYAWCLFFC